MPLPTEPCHILRLVRRKDSGAEVIHSHLGGNGCGGAVAVSGEHNGTGDPQSTEGGQNFLRLLPQRVGDADHGGQLPPYCQTIMFSATMPPKIRTLAKTILKDPEEVKIAISRPPESIMQTAYICYDPQKLKILQDLFTQSRPQRVIIFSSSKMKVKELASTLKRLKFNVAAMHSDLEQSQREEVMKEFKSGHIDILVATDVVARGIDINDIKLVVNFDIPHDPEDYVHRIGRTARGTNGEGLAITFVSIDEQAQFKRIEDFLEKEVYKIPVSPEFGEVPLYEPEKYGMNKRGRGRSRKSEDKGSSSSPQKRNMGHRGRPKKAQ